MAESWSAIRPRSKAAISRLTEAGEGEHQQGGHSAPGVAGEHIGGEIILKRIAGRLATPLKQARKTKRIKERWSRLARAGTKAKERGRVTGQRQGGARAVDELLAVELGSRRACMPKQRARKCKSLASRSRLSPGIARTMAPK